LWVLLGNVVDQCSNGINSNSYLIIRLQSKIRGGYNTSSRHKQASVRERAFPVEPGNKFLWIASHLIELNTSFNDGGIRTDNFHINHSLPRKRLIGHIDTRTYPRAAIVRFSLGQV